jgi:hypothetical protein
VQRVDRRNVNNGRAALAAVFTALVACTLLAATHSGASPTALTGWLATGKAGEPKFYEPPADAAAQGAESGLNSDPFHSNGANYGDAPFFPSGACKHNSASEAVTHVPAPLTLAFRRAAHGRARCCVRPRGGGSKGEAFVHTAAGRDCYL